MKKENYIVPTAEIVELSNDIILASEQMPDDEGWGILIPMNSANNQPNESEW